MPRFILREILQERKMSERQLVNLINMFFISRAEDYKARPNTINDICNNNIERLPVKLIDGISEVLGLQPGDWIKGND